MYPKKLLIADPVEAFADGVFGPSNGNAERRTEQGREDQRQPTFAVIFCT
jgi:hypothetical protein